MEWKDEVTRDITGDGKHRHVPTSVLVASGICRLLPEEAHRKMNM